MGRVPFIVWLLIAASIYFSFHLYFWLRLVRATALPAPWSTVATLGLALAALAPPVVILGGRLLGLPTGRLMGPALVLIAAGVMLLFVLLGSDLLRLALWLWARLPGAGAAEPDPQRRVLLARAVGGAASALTLGLTAFGVRQALSRPRLRRVKVALSRLPAALSGTTIVQISDIHANHAGRARYLARTVEMANKLQPDIVAITGDLVDGSLDRLAPAVRPLADLRARHGVFFVTGNHDHYSGAEPWVVFLRRMGIRVLRNERVTIGQGADSFELAGVEDPAGRVVGLEPDLDAALAGVPPEREVVLLAHRPSAITQAVEHRVGLQLSGHTHGGQFWPFTWLAHLIFPRVAGLSRHGETQLYVNSGTGYVGPPMRLGAPPELTLIELVS